MKNHHETLQTPHDCSVNRTTRSFRAAACSLLRAMSSILNLKQGCGHEAMVVRFVYSMYLHIYKLNGDLKGLNGI